MIKEGIQEIVQLARSSQDLELTKKLTETYDGYSVDYEYKIDPSPYGRKIGDVLEPYRPAELAVSTLTGFIDAINAGVAGDLSKRIVHVEDYKTVAVKSAICDLYGVRDTVLVAQHKPIDAFAFDRYYTDPAKFIIGLQVAFIPTEEILYLIKIASNLKAGKSIHVQDDGFSQSVTLKAGEVSTTEVNIKPRIKLVPLRTFAEPNPVTSEFLIRFQQTAEETPSIALFVVDGTKWQGEAMIAIKDYLAENLPSGTAILA